MSDDQPTPRVFRRKAARRDDPAASPTTEAAPAAPPAVPDHPPVAPRVEPDAPAAPPAEPDAPAADPEHPPAPPSKPPTKPAPQAVQLPTPLPEDWVRLHQVRPGVRQHVLGNLPLISFFRDAPATRAFDLLRSRLLQGIKAQGWRRIAIAAPTSGCGATFTAVNLALSLARIPDRRIILMDLNQRDPGVARALDIQGHGDMRGFLQGEVDAVQHLVRIGDTLALGLSDHADSSAAELLHAPEAGAILDELGDRFDADVVLYDLPAVLEHDDFLACLPHVDGVLLISDGTQTSAAQIAACEQVMGDQAGLLGVVLNRARASSAEV